MRSSHGALELTGLATLYTSLEPLTVRAELLRIAERQGEREDSLYPLAIVELIVGADVLDLERPGVLTDLGTGEPLSALTPLAGSRAIGQAAASLGIGAARVPSVATRATNLEQPPIVEALTALTSPDDWPAG